MLLLRLCFYCSFIVINRHKTNHIKAVMHEKVVDLEIKKKLTSNDVRRLVWVAVNTKQNS